MIVKRKEQSIETLRGIAIILMVAGHVIGHREYTGLGVADDSAWRYIYYTFEYLRMPLFTAISGFVYSLKPVNKEHVIKFMKGKSRRILLPFISVATLQYTLNAFIPNVNNPVEMSNIWKIYIFGYGQFWFLMAIFQVFIAVVVLEYFNILSKFKGWLITFLSSTILLIFLKQYQINIEFFQFTRFLYLLPFFLLGVGLNRFSNYLFNKKTLIIVISILTIGIFLQQLNWFTVGYSEHGRVGILGIVIGITGIWTLFHIRKSNKILAWLGYYSYGIYLFHVFGTAGSRIFSKFLGIDNTILLFAIGLTFGLGLPILMEFVILKSAVLRRIFLGLR